MSAYIIAAVFLFLVLLAGFMFLSHSIEKRRIQRQRLITALKARRNSFRDLATSFPAGFLSPDLSSLLYRALVDCCEKLVQLEPKDPSHTEQLGLYTSLIASQKEAAQKQRVRLENTEQIKEARQLLQELSKFVQQQSMLGLINELQTKNYHDQINRLVLQMSVDGHIVNARQAQQVGKPRLAIHHYSLAQKLLLSENATGAFEKQIIQLKSMIDKLEEKAVIAGEAPAQKTASSTGSTDPDAKINKEWDQFEEENAKWKKKNIYD